MNSSTRNKQQPPIRLADKLTQAIRTQNEHKNTMPKSSHVVLLSAACGVAARAIARSLRLSPTFKDALLVGMDTCKNQYGIAEGAFDYLYCVPACNENSYQDEVNHICVIHKIDAAIVNHDLETMFWTGRETPAPMLLPPPAFSAIAGSKGRLYTQLRRHNLVPKFLLLSREEILEQPSRPGIEYPVWIRDISIGSAGGKGALLVRNKNEMNAWVLLNDGSETFMISEFLPGRNFACQLLFVNGALVKHGSYERLEYFLGRMIPSGVSGNISRGRLLNDDRLLQNAVSAVNVIVEATGEIMNGFVAVDMREDEFGNPLITEINLRHVACTSAFAQAGHNLAEAHLLATLGHIEELGPVAKEYPEGNLILRDIDGPPMWVQSIPTPRIGTVASAVK